MTFYKWLIEQAGRDDPIGDLAGDTKEADCSFARGPNIGYEKWWMHLQRHDACWGAFEALRAAWGEYKGRNRETNRV